MTPGKCTHSGFCFRVRKPDLWLCQAGYVLPAIPKTPFKNGGQIEARGILNFASNKPSFVAITGGTRDFRRATGHIKLDGNTYTLTIYTP